MAERLRTIVSFIIGVLILMALFFIIDVGKLVVEMQSASLPLLIPLFPSWIGFFAVRAWRWKVLLHPLKDDVRMRVTFWSTIVGYMVNIIIPLRVGGEIARAYIVDEKEGTGFLQNLSSIAVERVLDLLSIILLAILALFLLPQGTPIPAWFADGLKVVGIFVATALILILVSTKRREKVLHAVDRIVVLIPYLRTKARGRVMKLLASIIEGAEGLAHSRRLMVMALGSSLLTWAFGFATFYTLFPAFGYDASIIVCLLGIMVMELSFIFPTAPAHVGTYEAFWVLIFMGLGFTRVETLMAMAFTAHITSYVFITILGYIGLLLLKLEFSRVLALRPTQKGGHACQQT